MRNDKRGEGEGLMKVLSGDSAKLNEYTIAKRVKVGECMGSNIEGQQWKRWINSVNECVKKSRFECLASRRMVC